MEKLKENIINAPIIKKGEYNYVIMPVTDGIPKVEPEILEEITDTILEKINLDGIELIVAAEAMAIHLATALSLKSRIPFIVLRKRQYGLPGETPVFQTTGYSTSELYINYINKGDKVLILDDVISTGGTIVAMIEALESLGIEIEEIIAVIEKGKGKEIVKEKTGHDVTTLIEIDVDNGKPIIKSTI